MRIPTLLRLTASAGLMLTTAGFSACNLQLGGGIEARDTWTRSYPAKAGATLEIREANGRVHVVAGDGETIEITATRIAKAPTEEAAQAALKEFTIEESVTTDGVSLDGMRGTVGLNKSRSVSYEVRVPRAISITVKGSNGDVEVDGIAGVLRVETSNGRVVATRLGDGADISSANGQIDLDFATIGASGVRCKTTNGQIIVTIPTSTKATIAGRVTNGIVHTENLTVQATEQSTRRLDATIGGGGPEIRLETVNGEVRVVGK
jgi:DUF4097 and DUF4098 domain-containing protein YvlB